MRYQQVLHHTERQAAQSHTSSHGVFDRFRAAQGDVHLQLLEMGNEWPCDVTGTLQLTHQQLDALVLGLPWQLMGEAGVIRLL